MDLSWTVITISTLLLLSADLTPAQTAPNDTSPSTQATSTNRTHTSPSAPPTTTASTTTGPSSSVLTSLGLITVRWHGCQGNVNLILSHSSKSMPVCDNSKATVKSLMGNVCQGMRGCKGMLEWPQSKDRKDGYSITESGAVESIHCAILMVRCKEEGAGGQLQAYKVVTGLLCCVLLVLLLIRLTKPTIRALQKRLSDRQKNRWIGPTQSHSVSYHRGKSAVKNNDGEKRMSYPALERLTVSDSREPSSSRNSYNF